MKKTIAHLPNGRQTKVSPTVNVLFVIYLFYQVSRVLFGQIQGHHHVQNIPKPLHM